MVGVETVGHGAVCTLGLGSTTSKSGPAFLRRNDMLSVVVLCHDFCASEEMVTSGSDVLGDNERLSGASAA